MDDKFYEWSIPNYFISNYFSAHFHAHCWSALNSQGNEPLITQFDHFVRHLVEGKWVHQFLLTDQQLKNIQISQEKDNSNIEIEHRFENYYSLIFALKFKFKCILFIAFVGKFFSIIYYDHQANTRKTLINQLKQLYFRFRVQVVFQNPDSVGAPPETVNLLKTIIQNHDKLNSVIQKKSNDLEIISQIAQQCEFHALLCKLTNLIQGVKTKSMSQFSNPHKNILKIEEMHTNMQMKNLRLNNQPTSNINTKIQKTEKIKQQQLKQSQEKFQSSSKPACRSLNEAFLAKKMKNLQNSIKIKKTTRFSNFKGVFLCKKKQFIKQIKQQQGKCQQTGQVEELKVKIFSRLSSRKKREFDQNDEYDILCDKSC